MRFRETTIPGVLVIELERLKDGRGFLARTFCEQEFSAHGLVDRFVQCSVSYNEDKGTLRGMHFQAAPHAEAKLVRCTAGAIFDVAVDLRAGSPQLARWFGVELTAENRRMLYIPQGCAHGFQTLAAGSEVLYQISEFHDPNAARGVRWDDPAFAISWPQEPHRLLCERDASYPDFSPRNGALQI
jgi:dTDP-4-dehydrorhamnose 3,5-epimerase